MVNYCCVAGCGRNSRTHNHLNYYGLPKERSRQIQWLKAACREDLLSPTTSCGNVMRSRRFCSRHFLPSSVKSNKLLFADAVPTLYLSGEHDDAEDSRQQKHEGLACNSCSKDIVGFRYKCISCEDYDLCYKCEASQEHQEHFMIRIPKPIKFGSAIKVTEKLCKLIKNQTNNQAITKPYESPINSSSESNDDEPITNYLKRKTSEGLYLTEDIKRKIRKEVNRALNSNLETIQKAHIESTEEETVVTDDVNNYLVDYLKKNDCDMVFANVADENLLDSQVKNETATLEEAQLSNMTSQITVEQDTLSEFLIKNK